MKRKSVFHVIRIQEKMPALIDCVNPKETMVRALKAGILQKELKITEYICKPCFKERCDKK